MLLKLLGLFFLSFYLWQFQRDLPWPLSLLNHTSLRSMSQDCVILIKPFLRWLNQEFEELFDYTFTQNQWKMMWHLWCLFKLSDQLPQTWDQLMNGWVWIHQYLHEKIQFLLFEFRVAILLLNPKILFWLEFSSVLGAQFHQEGLAQAFKWIFAVSQNLIQPSSWILSSSFITYKVALHYWVYLRVPWC